MKFRDYIIENQEIDESFISLEDPKIAKEFEYRFLKLKKAPKELNIVFKHLRKHLKKPLGFIAYESGSDTRNLATYSETLDAIKINLTELKKVKKLSLGKPPVNYHDQLKVNKESLEKWKEFYEDNPKNKKARGMVNRLSVSVRNLEDKINNNEVSLPGNSLHYAKSLDQAIESIILHELGHRAWKTADTAMSNVFFNQKQFPTEYSKRNVKEYHSEMYALAKMKALDKAPISKEAKDHFKKEYK